MEQAGKILPLLRNVGTLLGGAGPALVTTVLCTLQVWYFGVRPVNWYGLGALILTGVSVGVLCWLLNRAGTPAIPVSASDGDGAAELAAAHLEFDSFAYSVSHDLRAPLRAIDGFSRILLEDHGPELTAEALRCLEIVRNNAIQMNGLIDSLLLFSRLSRQPLQKESVDVRKIVGQALEDLAGERADRRIEFVIGELPACDADPLLFRQVLVNLLSNALKYTRLRSEARIEIGASGQPGEGTVYFVRDNGAGFDLRFADKLFGVFQRLHSAKDYEGTGVGLAIVRRIVTRHGGRVWADGVVDQGATFYFSLPAKGRLLVPETVPDKSRVTEEPSRPMSKGAAL